MTDMQLHKEFDFLDIHWCAETQTVVMTWKRFVKGDQFRAGLDEGLNLLSANRSANWLADLRDLGTVTKEDQEWSNVDWYPRAILAGIRNMAIIMPRSVLSTMSVKNILTKVQDIDVETRYFDSVDDAQDWLGALKQTA